MSLSPNAQLRRTFFGEVHFRDGSTNNVPVHFSRKHRLRKLEHGLFEFHFILLLAAAFCHGSVMLLIAAPGFRIAAQ
jgi:hypothetical protein